MSDPNNCEEVRTISVPEAGHKYFGLSRDGSYRAAKRGDIPVIPVGKRLRVPIAAMDRILAGVGRSSNRGFDPNAAETAVTA